MLGLVLLLLTSCHYTTAQTVALFISSGQLCPEERVSYTCVVRRGVALEWILEPYLLSNDSIRFLANAPTGMSVNCNNVGSVRCADLNFVATLTNTANHMTVNVQGATAMVADMNSTLTMSASTTLNGRVVQCRETTENGSKIIDSTTLSFSVPSPPRTPSSTVQQYGQDSVTLTVQWQPPQYDGGAPVNYTITVSPGLSPVTTSGTSVPVTVAYNVIHNVTIVATNCNGNSSAAMESINIVNCGDPTVPRNGSIDSYQNTTEGAEIFFRCNPGFVPAGRMRAVCAADGRWNPDPVDTICTSSPILTTTNLVIGIGVGVGVGGSFILILIIIIVIIMIIIWRKSRKSAEKSPANGSRKPAEESPANGFEMKEK